MTTKEIAIADTATDGAIVKAVEAAATSLGLRIALRISTRTYPGSIHWHFKKLGEPRGMLELTYWPETKRLWAKVHRGRRAKWIAGSLAELAGEIAGRVAAVRPKPVRRDAVWRKPRDVQVVTGCRGSILGSPTSRPLTS
jgi:hypothetical protein